MDFKIAKKKKKKNFVWAWQQLEKWSLSSNQRDCVPWGVFWKLPSLLSMREERWLTFIVQCITSTQRNENRISCVWLFITKATYEKKPCNEVLLELISSLHGEWQLCWGWAWLAAVPQCCVPRILSLCNSCSSHRQRDRVRTEETRRGCCNPWRERTRETDTLIVCVSVCVCVCVCAEAPTCIKSLNVWHLKGLNFRQYVIKMSN